MSASNTKSLASHPQSLALLGPPGSYTSAAANSLDSDYECLHFNSDLEVTLALREGRCNFALMAVENQLGGSISYNLDTIFKENFRIVKEVRIAIHHCIAAKQENRDIKSIYSHPQGFLQCQQYLQDNYPAANLINTDSTAQAFELVVKGQDTTSSAAIGSKDAAQFYGLNIIDSNIEDFSGNQTRFFLVTSSNNKSVVTQAERTTLALRCKHQPGSLLDCLEPFRKHGINMTKLESRPIPDKSWEYYFYLDFDHNQPMEIIDKALKELGEVALEYKVLGSYGII